SLLLGRPRLQPRRRAHFDTLYFVIPDPLRSHRMKRLALVAVLAFSCTLAAQAQTTKPKVRAITAFVRLDAKNYQHQLAEALIVLHKTETEFKSAGYEVETIRFTTQPLADLTAGLSEDQALTFLGQLDQLAAKEKVAANIGPAMLRETDDPKTMHL